MFSTAATVEVAKERAIAKCKAEAAGKECEVAVSECSNPVYRSY